jgi:hypothetical protein
MVDEIRRLHSKPPGQAAGDDPSRMGKAVYGVSGVPLGRLTLYESVN